MTNGTFIRAASLTAALLCTPGIRAANAAVGNTDTAFTPETLTAYGVPDWYRDAKLGVFMHLSAFTVPAFKGAWYPHNMYYVEGVHKDFKKPYREHHEAVYGSLKEFGYKDFIPMLTLEKFDAAYYADLTAACGAEYFAAPAVHHDGFAMWDSKEIEWNSVRMGPHRDVVGELTEAMRARGIKTGVSTHYGRHWRYYTFRPEFDTWDPAYEGLYGKRRGDNDPPRAEDALQWERVMKELIGTYQPDYTFVDGGICDAHAKYNSGIFREALYRVTAWYYNQSRDWGKEVVLSWKRDAMKPDEALYDTEKENKLYGEGICPFPWQAHITIKTPDWCYIEGEKMLPVDGILRKLVDVVSRNGNLLINIGPKADGTLPPAQEKVLLEIGAWMKVNGAAIHGTRPWKTHGTGKINHTWGYDSDAVRFTRKDDCVYAFFFTWPENGEISFPWEMYQHLTSITLMGSSDSLDWKVEQGYLIVELPKKQPGSYVWCIQLKNIIDGI